MGYSLAMDHDAGKLQSRSANLAQELFAGQDAVERVVGDADLSAGSGEAHVGSFCMRACRRSSRWPTARS